jgi:hypothetical protein
MATEDHEDWRVWRGCSCWTSVTRARDETATDSWSSVTRAREETSEAYIRAKISRAERQRSTARAETMELA